MPRLLHRKVIRLADPVAREDTAVLTDSRTWIRALCEVLLASGGRDGVVRLWDLKNRGELVASLTGHRGWVFALCTVRVSGRDLLASAGREDPRDGRLVRTMVAGPRRLWTHALCQVRMGGRTLQAEAASGAGGGDDEAGVLVVADGAQRQLGPRGGLTDLRALAAHGGLLRPEARGSHGSWTGRVCLPQGYRRCPMSGSNGESQALPHLHPHR